MKSNEHNTILLDQAEKLIRDTMARGPELKGEPRTQVEMRKKTERVPLHLVCPAGMVHEAQAMREGYLKYGYASYLNDEVKMTALECLGAAMRHIIRLQNGEDCAPDSGVHHAGHARAMLGIYLECMEAGKLVDDRHPKRGYIGPLMDCLAVRNAKA